MSAQCYGAVRRRQSDECLATEQPSALSEDAVIQIEAAFERKHGLITAAEIFASLESSARPGKITGLVTYPRRGTPALQKVIRILDTDIENAVQRH